MAATARLTEMRKTSSSRTAANHLQGENNAGDEQNHDEQFAAQLGQPLLQRRGLRRLALQQIGDPPEFGAHACGDDNGHALPATATVPK